MGLILTRIVQCSIGDNINEQIKWIESMRKKQEQTPTKQQNG